MLKAAREGLRFRASDHLMVVPRSSDYAIYHAIFGCLCLADKRAIDLLQYFRAGRTVEEALHGNQDLTARQIDSFLRLFRGQRMIVRADEDESRILPERQRQRETDLISGRQVRIIQLVLSNRCNFRCQYCFEGLGATPLSETRYAHSSPERLEAQRSPSNSFMRPEQAQVYLEHAIRMATAAGITALAVQFFGGEPLICWKTIRHVLQHFGRGGGFDIGIDYSIVTNGSLITDEVARTFREFQVPVVVSYDSPKSQARPMAGGKDSHEEIRRGLELLRSYGNRIVLNSVLGNDTFDSFGPEIVDYAFSHGVYEIGVVLDFDPSFYKKRTHQQIVDRLWEVCTYGWSKGVVITGYWHQIFQGLTSNDRYGRIGFQNCSAMGVQFSIEPSGAVFSCKASGGHFGNILKLEDLLRSPTVQVNSRY